MASGTPSASATSCGKIVLVPWPISVEAVRMLISPSPVSSSEATEASLTSPDPVKPGTMPGERQPDPAGDPFAPAPQG